MQPQTLTQTSVSPRRTSGGSVLLLSAIVAALGSFLFGFDTAVISGTTEALRQVFSLRENLLGITVSSALLGTMVISHSLAAWVFQTHAQGWIVIAAMMGVVGSHAYSQVPVVWVMINELLPNAIRASGSALVCFLVWVLCAGVSWSFPVVAAASGANAFGFFAVLMVLQFVLVLKYLPETKEISLEELERRIAPRA